MNIDDDDDDNDNQNIKIPKKLILVQIVTLIKL